MKQNMKRANEAQAVIYVRECVGEVGNGVLEMPSQETLCREYAKQNGYEVVGIFRDTWDDCVDIQRNGLEFLLDLVSECDIVTVIVAEKGVLPKSLRELGYDYEVLEERGVKFIVAEGKNA